MTNILNWPDDIFAYFDHPITNAYTESLSNLIRVVNRVGRGYSFEALRARILFTEGFRKVKKQRYQRQRIPEGAMDRMPVLRRCVNRPIDQLRRGHINTGAGD